MNIFSTLFLIFNFVIGIALIVYYISHFKEVNSYAKYGIFISVVYVVLMVIGGGFQISSMPLLIISFFKIAIYICIGMHLCTKLGLKSLPLLKKVFRDNDRENVDIKEYSFYTLAVIIGASVFSYVLFKLTSPSISETFKGALESGNALSEFGQPPSISLILIVLSTVITEEIIFRFVIPNYLANKFKLEYNKYWISIVISSLLWTFAHANTLNPEWVKFAQIFPVGLALGKIYKKFGLESCIIAHAGFNIIMMFISGSLIGY